jgi:hypothetical protein
MATHSPAPYRVRMYAHAGAPRAVHTPVLREPAGHSHRISVAYMYIQAYHGLPRVAGLHSCRHRHSQPNFQPEGLQWWLQRCSTAWPVQGSTCSRSAAGCIYTHGSSKTTLPLAAASAQLHTALRPAERLHYGGPEHGRLPPFCSWQICRSARWQILLSGRGQSRPPGWPGPP